VLIRLTHVSEFGAFNHIMFASTVADVSRETSVRISSRWIGLRESIFAIDFPLSSTGHPLISVAVGIVLIDSAFQLL
jgi:hypothetical protein